MPRPIGALIKGTDYQVLFTWNAVVLLLEPEDDIEYVGIELGEWYPADDVVIARGARAVQPSEYVQVKYHVSKAGAYSNTNLAKNTARRKPSLVKGFWNVWAKVREAGGSWVEIGLVSNWGLEPRDPLGPYLRDEGLLHQDIVLRPRPGTRECVRRWKKHLGCDDNGLVNFLKVLRLRLSEPSYLRLLDHVKYRMRGLGLKSDRAAVLEGMNIVKQWIGDGVERVTRALLEEAIDRARLRTSGGRPVSEAVQERAIEQGRSLQKSSIALRKLARKRVSGPGMRTRSDSRLERRLVTLQEQDQARKVLAVVGDELGGRKRSKRA